MSEQPKTIKIGTVKEGVVKIDIGSGYLARIQQLLFYFVKDEPEDKVTEAIIRLKTQEPQNDFEYHLLSILTLMYNAEAAFKEAGLLQDHEVEVPSSTP